MATFHLFNSFPPEIQLLIVASCPPNDRTCLRLTCKSLYNISPSFKTSIRLTNDDRDHAINRRLCSATEGQAVSGNAWSSRIQHGQVCHASTYNNLVAQAEREGLPKPRNKKNCRSRIWIEHCECFSGKPKLYQRLKNWTPKGLNYCGACEKFTRRKPSHKGRCSHGRIKKRQRERNFWTHRSRNGAFGRKLWKKWVRNSEMDRYEQRLRMQYERKGTDRYHLRKWIPRDIDTREIRTGESGFV